MHVTRSEVRYQVEHGAVKRRYGREMISQWIDALTELHDLSSPEGAEHWMGEVSGSIRQNQNSMGS
jgi:hypothetical protein